MDPRLYPIWKVLLLAMLAGVIYYLVDRLVLRRGFAWATGLRTARQWNWRRAEVLVWACVLAALFVSGGMVFMHAPMDRLAAVSSMITEQGPKEEMGLEKLAKVMNKLWGVWDDVHGGHVPPNEYAVVDSVFEHHAWDYDHGLWRGTATVTIMGFVKDVPAGRRPKINVELGPHNTRKEQLQLLVVDKFAGADSVMQEGANEGEWQVEWESLPDSKKGVSKLEIWPRLYEDTGRPFFITFRYKKHESREAVSTRVLYIAPCDFGQKTLGHVSGSVCWPFDVGEQHFVYAAWEQDDAAGKVFSEKWTLEPLDDFKVWAVSKTALSYESVGRLKRAVAFLYERGEPESLLSGYYAARRFH